MSDDGSQVALRAAKRLKFKLSAQQISDAQSSHAFMGTLRQREIRTIARKEGRWGKIPGLTNAQIKKVYKYKVECSTNCDKSSSCSGRHQQTA